MSTEAVLQLTLVALAAVLAPVIAEPLRRFAIPAVVLEICLGVLIDPQGLGLVQPEGLVLSLADLGLSMLMFLAGYELRLRTVRGRPLVLAGTSWAMSLVLAAVVGLVLHLTGSHHAEVVVPLALTTTALGTLLPVLRDSRLLGTDFGRYALALGSVGEFGPIVLVGLLLSGGDPVQSILFLGAFFTLVVMAAWLASRPWGSNVVSALQRGMSASSQLPIRLTLLFVLALTAVAGQLGLDVLMAAFAAGLVARIAAGGHEEDDETVFSSMYATKLEAIGFGFLVPIFFVVSGTRIDLRSLVASPSAALFVPLFLALMLVVRVVPTYLCYGRGILDPPKRRALSVMAATGLPLIVVIATVATDNGYLGSADAAAMVAGGMLSVLLLPALSIRLLGRRRERPVEPGAGL